MKCPAPLLLVLAGIAPAWALEPSDVRLHLDLVAPDYEISFAQTSRENEFDHSFTVRAAMVQPLNLLQVGDLIAVIGLSYNDSLEEDAEGLGVDLTYQGSTLRYGMGYRAAFGPAFSLDAYPYVGVGWTSFELGDFGNDPSLLLEAGAELDAAATFGQWQVGGSVSYAYRYSDHTVAEVEFEMEHVGIAFGGFVGYRF